MSRYDVFHMKTPYLTPCQTAFMTIKIVGLSLQARQASAIGLPRRHCVDVQDMLYEQSSKEIISEKKSVCLFKFFEIHGIFPQG